MAGTVTQACLPRYDVVYISPPNVNFCLVWHLKQETRYLSDRPPVGLYVHRTLQLRAYRPCETGASHSGEYEHSILVCDAVKFGND